MRVAKKVNNQLDVAIDIALFIPSDRYVSVAANAAGTKLVYTQHGGKRDTYWARDWTLNAANRKQADALLTALIAQQTEAD